MADNDKYIQAILDAVNDDDSFSDDDIASFGGELESIDTGDLENSYNFQDDEGYNAGDDLSEEDEAAFEDATRQAITDGSAKPVEIPDLGKMKQMLSTGDIVESFPVFLYFDNSYNLGEGVNSADFIGDLYALQDDPSEDAAMDFVSKYYSGGLEDADDGELDDFISDVEEIISGGGGTKQHEMVEEGTTVSDESVKEKEAPQPKKEDSNDSSKKAGGGVVSDETQKNIAMALADLRF